MRPVYDREANPITDAELASRAEIEQTVDWTDPRLARVERFRLLTDPGFPMYDVSYVNGRLRSGEPVWVRVPFHQLPKRTWKTALVDYAKADGVNARRLGFFDALSTVS